MLCRLSITMVIACGVACTTYIKTGSAEEKIDASPILNAVLERYIQPSYHDFQDDSVHLMAAVHSLCEHPTKAHLQKAQAAFSLTAKSWAHIEWLRVGPVMADYRLERVLFYPDRKGTGLRQVQRALIKQDRTTLDVDSLSQKSVAMQGLGALEFLLFGTGHENLADIGDAYRCQYALAIASNLSQIATALVDGWKHGSQAADAWLNPNLDNLFFRDDTEALNRLIGTLIHGMEAIRDVRLGSFLYDEPQKDRPKSAIFWRSDSSMAMITQGLKGLAQFYEVSGLTAYVPEDQSWLKSSMDFEMAQTVRTAMRFEKPVVVLLQDEADRDRLLYLKLTMDFAIQRLDQEFAPALGLKAGFSFGDGD